MPRRKKNKHVGIVLDASGSMASMREMALEGFNKHLAGARELAKTGARGDFTVMVFSNATGPEFNITHDAVPLKEIEPLRKSEYEPNGMTPLYDAVAKTISRLDSVVRRGEDALLIVITDGHENASKEHSNASIKRLVEDRQRKGWRIEYIGCDGLQEQALGMGIMSGNIHSANLLTKDGYEQGMTYAAVSTTSYLAGTDRPDDDQSQ